MHLLRGVWESGTPHIATTLTSPPVFVLVVRPSCWFLPRTLPASPISALPFLLSPQHERAQRGATVGGAFLQCHQVRGYSTHRGAEARTQRSKDSYTSYSEYCGVFFLFACFVGGRELVSFVGQRFLLWETDEEMQK